jgi:hypothetical protein
MGCTPSLPRLLYKITYKTVLTVINRVAILQNLCCNSTKRVKISLLERESSSPAAPVIERQRAAEASPQGCTLSFFMMDGGVNIPASGGTSFYFQGCEGRMTFCRVMVSSCGAGRGACEISEELIGNDVPCDFSQVPCNFPQVPYNFPHVPYNFS